jgi:hypothetical protein
MAEGSEDKFVIYYSDEFEFDHNKEMNKDKTALILINGMAGTKPALWSTEVCVNENIYFGSMIP